VLSTSRGGALRYCVNDVAEVGEGGVLFGHGRKDDVVKLNGYRVELGEVEHFAGTAPGVTRAAVLVSGTALVTFVQPADGVSTEAVKAHVAEHVPHYMVPTTVYAIPELPLMANGKLDRAAMKRLNELQLTLGGSGGGESTTEEEIIECIRAVTGAKGKSSSALAELGVDSLTIVKLVAELDRALGVHVDELTIMQHPVISDLARYVDRLKSGEPEAEGGDAGGAKHINMDALFGLRSILCLWIVRGHMEVYCEGALQDTDWNDRWHYWRTNIFMFMAGASLTMQFDKNQIPTLRLLRNNVPQLFPMYWVGYATAFPTIGPGCLAWKTGEYATEYVMELFLLQGLYMPFWGIEGVVMGHCWYLAGQIFFLCFFNIFQRMLKAGTSCFSIDPATGVKKTGITDLRQFWTWCAVCWLCALPGKFLHVNGILRLPTFVQGMIIGQAAMHVELTPDRERQLGRWIDGVTLLLVLVCQIPHSWLVLLFLGDLWLGFICFGIARVDCLTARFLSRPLIKSLAPYSYGIYILHPPVIFWARTVARYGLKTWGDIRDFDYSQVKCDRKDDTSCWMYPFSYITVMTTVIVFAVLITELVHFPAQRLMNRWLNSVDRQRTLTRPRAAKAEGGRVSPRPPADGGGDATQAAAPGAPAPAEATVS